MRARAARLAHLHVEDAARAEREAAAIRLRKLRVELQDHCHGLLARAAVADLVVLDPYWLAARAIQVSGAPRLRPPPWS
jgi:hypothetical protein